MLFPFTLRVCNKLTSPNTTGMIRSCSNRYGNSRYEFFDGYRRRSCYQPTKTHITCPLVPSQNNNGEKGNPNPLLCVAHMHVEFIHN